MKLNTFSGLNNVAGATRLDEGELLLAENVDICATGQLRSALGRTALTSDITHSLFESEFGLLGVVEGALVRFNSDGTVAVTYHPSFGCTRVWYTPVATGVVGASNGLSNLLLTATAATPWGMPTPVDAGYGAGDTPYLVCYRRQSDGREGPARYGVGGVALGGQLHGLPALAGYDISVYVAPYLDKFFFAGQTSTDTVSIASDPTDQYLGSISDALPPGRCLSAWGSRILIASGDTLWATRPFQHELCDLKQDFVRLDAEITMVWGVSAGVFVGTTNDLYFLEGAAFEQLRVSKQAKGRVVLGSLAVVGGELMNAELLKGSTTAAVCVHANRLTALFDDGRTAPLEAGRFVLGDALVEASAAIRVRNGEAQYVLSAL